MRGRRLVCARVHVCHLCTKLVFFARDCVTVHRFEVDPAGAPAGMTERSSPVLENARPPCIVVIVHMHDTVLVGEFLRGTEMVAMVE